MFNKLSAMFIGTDDICYAKSSDVTIYATAVWYVTNNYTFMCLVNYGIQFLLLMLLIQFLHSTEFIPNENFHGF